MHDPLQCGHTNLMKEFFMI